MCATRRVDGGAAGCAVCVDGEWRSGVSNGGGGGMLGEIVGKVYVDATKATRAMYFVDVEMQQIAIRYAALYN